MMSQNGGPNVNDLFAAAHAEGDLSMASMTLLQNLDVGNQIQGQLGLPALDVPSSELFLVRIKVDDSSSIRFVKGNTEAVRDGHNGVIDDLMGSKARDSILFGSDTINGMVINNWCLLEDAVRLDQHFDPSGGTPLYDSGFEMFSLVVAKAAEAKNNGQVVRTASCLVTDGHDEGSRKFTARDVDTLVRDMLMQETHIVSGMGISDAPKECSHCGANLQTVTGTECPQCRRGFHKTDFHAVFSEMGIPDSWILTPGNTPQEIRRAFNTFSSSAVRASQNAASFSKTAMGGFGV